jgi:hypothetical protein
MKRCGEYKEEDVENSLVCFFCAWTGVAAAVLKGSDSDSDRRDENVTVAERCSCRRCSRRIKERMRRDIFLVWLLRPTGEAKSSRVKCYGDGYGDGDGEREGIINHHLHGRLVHQRKNSISKRISKRHKK